MGLKDIDTWRKGHLAVAEFVDAWRLIPRALVAGYGFVTWKVVEWYMNLEPHMMENCDPAILAEACIVQAPSTQHAALVTAVVGIAAAVFGLYANSGKKWNGFTYWNKKEEKSSDSA
jgi:hypothetical protein